MLPAAFDPLPKLTLDELPQAPQPTPAPAAGSQGRGRSPTGPFDALYTSATRENASGDILLKLVNVQATPQLMRIDIQGVQTIKKDASGEMITGELGASNTVVEPMKVAPKPIVIRDAGATFSHELPAHSVSVIRLKTR